MSGVSVVRYLIANNAPVLAVIPSGRIIAGPLPLGTVLPAIQVTQVDNIPQHLLRINETPRVYEERVQAAAVFYGAKATTPGTGYLGVYQMMKLILAACPSQRGTINGFAVDSIIPILLGPDLHDQSLDLYSSTWDFSVRWSA